ncbi:hypothetical protein [Streptomyces sp. SID3343]|uniref:hypothetical protein n=1 Tax=Streptomyces sp. SID3343 TaxID=2690260 RepID=UPI00136C45D7|nr:hypothetical protein [Streptomyces sp. SID3343]
MKTLGGGLLRRQGRLFLAKPCQKQGNEYVEPPPGNRVVGFRIVRRHHTPAEWNAFIEGAKAGEFDLTA